MGCATRTQHAGPVIGRGSPGARGIWASVNGEPERLPWALQGIKASGDAAGAISKAERWPCDVALSGAGADSGGRCLVAGRGLLKAGGGASEAFVDDAGVHAGLSQHRAADA
jgi:hypothetical protein